MSSYATRAEVEALIAQADLARVLDPDKSGTEHVGLFDAIVAAASLEVEALLGMAYEVPFTSPYPAIVRRAALVFTLETCWRRKGASGDANPWARAADALRETLRDIAAGRMALDTSQSLVGSFSTRSSSFEIEADATSSYGNNLTEDEE
jgi:phage gp36-like protein